MLKAEMKEVVLIFITLSLVTAHVTRDWSKILPSRETVHRGYNQLESSEDTRIVGGSEAVPNSIPYQAALRLFYDDGSTNFCGGSLITKRYVLTAAHCLVDNLVSLEVILGAHKFRENEATQQSIPTSTFKVHERFNNQTLENDVGVVYLETPAEINRYVQVIALPSRADVSNSFAGSAAIASGWGYTSTSASDVTEALRYINVTILTKAACSVTYKDVRDSVICSSGAGKKGLCAGDSGGPLAANKKLVGVASFRGFNGCEAGDPSGFSRVTSFLNWIKANTDAVIS
ncbi:brachyurin-like [Agrilus planipennis]|uniref:Brachyurin-like n=1 Tax=Agrilus planipennis TaxID=224129 RepID=A0A7F5RJG9_AGRPL|nr:brachyurin-like [Agrilus planipennis]